MLSVRWGPIQTFLMVNLQPALNNCPLVARTVFQLEIGKDCSQFALFQIKTRHQGLCKRFGREMSLLKTTTLQRFLCAEISRKGLKFLTNF